MSRAARRRLLGALGAGPLAATLTGCIGLPEVPAHVHYELEDAGRIAAAPARVPARDARTLRISGAAASAFLDGTGLAYSRAPGARAYYRLASWSERPAVRIARLLERRLASAGAFGDVASAGTPVRTDWLLELQLEQFFHDDVSPPGSARIELAAELIDWTARRVTGRRRFAHSEPLAGESAAQAVAAFNRALARLLDELQAWTIALAAASQQPGRAPAGS
ncbi:MAG: membrane integrity-associated transporter subunit PqiC [Burkholderiaceae bacterium]|nr:membrane integrity-associated transporter subunit PqiC [Burkholderiaceae bacterium]